MNKIREFFTRNPTLGIMLAAVVVFIAWQFGGAALDTVRALRTSRSVGVVERQAGDAQGVAREAQEAANASGVDRAVEDGVRERVIAPELGRRRAMAEVTRERVRRAETIHGQAKTDIRRGAVDDADLHRRNCTELRELFPGEAFAGCE